MTLTDSLKAIEKWLEQNGVSGDELPQSVDKEVWKEVERAFPIPIPQDVRELYQWHNGMPDWLYFFQTWTVIPLEEVIKVREMYGEVFTTNKYQEAWSTSWFPFLADGAGDYLFVDLKNSKVYKFTHEGGHSIFISRHLSEFFALIRSDIESGLYYFDNYEVNYSGEKILE